MNKNIVFENKILKNGEDIIKEFDYPIEDIIEFEKAIVVLASRDFHKQSNENVYSVDYKGKLLWQVPNTHRSIQEAPL